MAVGERRAGSRHDGCYQKCCGRWGKRERRNATGKAPPPPSIAPAATLQQDKERQRSPESPNNDDNNNRAVPMGFSVMTAPPGAVAHKAPFSMLATVERPFCWSFFALNVVACVTAAARATLVDTVICATVALAIAEASTSLFHYWGDRRVFITWPLFCHYDRAYARHHRDPDDIVASGAMGYAQWVGDVALLPLCAPVWLMLVLGDAPLSTVASIVLWVCTFIAIAADTHRLAHCAPADVPAAVAALQACGLLLSADSHERHHELVRRTGRLAYFSVLTGWSNRLQDLLGAGPRLSPSSSPS